MISQFAEVSAARTGVRLAEHRSGRESVNPFLDYFRCPDSFAQLGSPCDVSEDAGYFAFGNAMGYGKVSGRQPSVHADGVLPDVWAGTVSQANGRLELPFDLADVMTNLRQERYAQRSGGYLERLTGTTAARNAYYFLRPVLPVQLRKHIQKVRLAGWERITFPRWPVDFTVDTLAQAVSAAMLEHRGIRRMPFVWFWPDGAEGCVMMTHDVESRAGRAFCGELMDLDDSFEIASAFQLVPEAESSEGLWGAIRSKGFEVNLHDLNHDGMLFQNKREFMRCAAKINRYVREFQCQGFRSGGMYREQTWYDAFDFDYDMSVPSAAHLEPQRGGCCTTMPYFIGDILELPLTTTQDYSLFHILGSYSTTLWKEEVESILARNGLVSFITHPDYLIEKRARATYVELLRHLSALRVERNIWFAPPADVNRWWRDRHQMTLVAEGDSWRVAGPGSERARVAYAELDGDRVVYSLSDAEPKTS